MMESIGRLVHWKNPMSSAILSISLNLDIIPPSSTFVKVSNGKPGHTMEFSKYFLDTFGVVWFTF